MAFSSKKIGNAAEIDRLALAFAKEPSSKVFIPLAEEYGKAGMWEEAVAVLEDGLKANPGFITAMVALGRAYDQLNQPVKAKAILEEAIKSSPENLRAHRILAKLYGAQGAKEAAIRSCNVILSIHPHDQEALSLRAGLDVPTVHAAAQTQRQVDGKPMKASDLDSNHLRGEDMASALNEEMSPMKDTPHDLSGRLPCSEGIPVLLGGPTAKISKKTRSPVIAQLEQWLSSVRTRRQNP